MDSENREEEITPEPRALPSLELSLSLSLSLSLARYSMCVRVCMWLHSFHPQHIRMCMSIYTGELSVVSGPGGEKKVMTPVAKPGTDETCALSLSFTVSFWLFRLRCSCSDPALASSDANRRIRVLRHLRRAAVGQPLHAPS